MRLRRVSSSPIPPPPERSIGSAQPHGISRRPAGDGASNGGKPGHPSRPAPRRSSTTRSRARRDRPSSSLPPFVRFPFSPRAADMSRRRRWRRLWRKHTSRGNGPPPERSRSSSPCSLRACCGAGISRSIRRNLRTSSSIRNCRSSKKSSHGPSRTESSSTGSRRRRAGTSRRNCGYQRPGRRCGNIPGAGAPDDADAVSRDRGRSRRLRRFSIRAPRDEARTGGRGARRRPPGWFGDPPRA